MSDFLLYGKEAAVHAIVYVDGDKYVLLDNGDRREAVRTRNEEYETGSDHPEYVIDTDE